MARLPVPGADDNVWGQILNDFLSAIHNPDGSLKVNVVNTTNIVDGSVTAAKLADTYILLSMRAQPNGVASLDSSGLVPPSQIPPQGSVPDATTLVKGVVQLTGDISGTATNVTVPGLATKIDVSTVTTKGDIIAATGNAAVTRVGAGANNTVLVANSAAAAGVSWTNITAGMLPDATAISKGVVQLAGDLGGTAASPTVPGLTNKIDKSILTTKGDLLTATGPSTEVRLGVGADNTVLVADSAQADGIKWAAISAAMLPDATAISKGVVQLAGDFGGTAASPTVPGKVDKSTLTTKGDIFAATAASTVTRVGVGSDTFVLTADSTQPTGVKWAAASGGTPADATTSSKGIVELAGDIGGTATNVTVLATHLTAALPINQGGTGSTTQNFVDLTTGQNIAGIKTFTTEVIVPAPVNPTDAVTKAYVDALSSGVSVKASVQEATAAALPSNTYNNGASGVGATLTEVGNGALTVDGIAVSTNDRVLIKDEVTQSHNGIYVVTDTGSAGTPYILTRSTDMNLTGEIPGAFTFVEAGTVNSAAGFVVASVGPFTVGSTSIIWTQFSGAGEITAGTGLSKSGNTLSVVYGTGAGSSAQGNDSRITGAIQSSTATTKGDILAATAGSTVTRLGVGADNKVLTADSSQATGLNWLSISPGMLPDATTLAKGIVQLAGDLGGTAASPTVPGLANKVNTSQLGIANGVATLDANGLLTTAQRPATFLPWSMTSTISVQTGTQRLYNDSGATWTIAGVRASLGTAPAGASAIFDINVNGTTIFTSQGNRPTIAAAGNTSGNVTNMDVTTIANGNYFTVDVDQVGSSIAGADLTIQIEVR